MGIMSTIEKGIESTAKRIGKAGMATGGVIGKGAIGYGKAMANNIMKSPGKAIATAAAVGTAGYLAADADGRNDEASVVGKAVIGATLASAIPGATTIGAGIGAGMVGVASSVSGMGVGLGSKMITLPNEPIKFSNIDKVKMSGIGTGVMIGAGLYEGVGRAKDKFVQGRMGRHDGMMRSSTPVIPQFQSNMPSYANNGGATGDLVFSMYNNR